MLFLAKVERSPVRFGLAGGFLLLPLLDIAQESAVRVVTGHEPLEREMILSFFAADALAGALLGAAVLNAWVMIRRGERTRARLCCGAVGAAVFIGIVWFAFSRGIWSGASSLRANGAFIPTSLGPFFNLITGRNIVFYSALGTLLWAVLSSSKRPFE